MTVLKKPRFIDPAGDPRTTALFVRPPFLFRNVTARSFPLRANTAVLTNFCNNYLNMDVDPSIVHYAPALPYVYLTIMNYGSMVAASVQAQNVGWVSQHEVAFMIIVQRWRKENGKLVFKDWATVSPFIFVDDQISLNTGREVYGWNKVGCQINADIPLWAGDPRAPLRQFDLSIVDFAKPYTGDVQSDQTLLQVDLDAPPTFTEFPPDPRNPWSPLWSIPSAIANTASFLGSAIDTALSLRIRGYEDNRSLSGVLAMAAKAGDKLRSLLPGIAGSLNVDQEATDLADAMAGLPKLFLDSVTLKQFRNPEIPSMACYQALVNSKMGVDRLNRAGLLGDVNLLRGDSSGGYTIRIHQHDAQPIIQTLGLVVDSWSPELSPDAVANLKPVLPMWLDVDLYYGKGDVICSRAPWGVAGPSGGWIDEQKDKLPAEPPEPSVSSEPKTMPPPFFNDSLGAATQPIAGPFHFPDVTGQVYPLLADPEKLAAVVQNYLNDPLKMMYVPGTDSGEANITKGWRFEPFGSYVYMGIVASGGEFGQTWSNSNNIGGLFDREITFGIPVKWFDGDDNLISLAMIEPFMYSNNGRAVTSDREVDGYNATAATIDSLQDPWLTPNGPIAKRRFLRVATEVIPVLNAGQKAQQRTLMEIDECEVLPANDAAGWRVVADGWGRDLIEELKRKTRLAATRADQVTGAKALALELLAHGMSINRLIFKQYRDSEELDTACYQALVQGTSTITSIYDMREIDADCHLRIYRQPGHPIAEALGLKIARTESYGGEVIDIIQPSRPFWMRYAARDDLSTVACYRADDGPWQNVHPWFAKANEDLSLNVGGAVARRRLAGQKPFFSQSGATRVGKWLARTEDHPAQARPTGAELQDLLDRKKMDAWFADRLKSAVAGASLHLDLKNNSDQWLRRSLLNQISWIRVGLESLGNAKDKEKYVELFRSSILYSVVSSLLSCDIDPGSMEDLCHSLSLRDLSAARKIMQEKPLGADLFSANNLKDRVNKEYNEAVKQQSPSGFEIIETELCKSLQLAATGLGGWLNTTTTRMNENVLAWGWEGYFDCLVTVQSLMESLNYMRALPSDRAQAFLIAFPSHGLAALESLAKYIEVKLQDADNGRAAKPKYRLVNFKELNETVSELQLFKSTANLLEQHVMDWVAPSRWAPIFHDNAKEIIESLPEMQLVIDDILSSEWENRGVTRWANPKAGRKPNQYIPDSPDVALHAKAQGLSRWIDPLTQQESQFWIAELPFSPPPKRRPRRSRKATKPSAKTEEAGPTAEAPPGG